MTTPSTTQPDEDARGKHQNAERQATRIATFVMSALGKPPDFFRVTVVKVWENRFRVNVQTGNVLSASVAHSYFLAADENGQIMESDPAIIRTY